MMLLSSRLGPLSPPAPFGQGLPLPRHSSAPGEQQAVAFGTCHSSAWPESVGIAESQIRSCISYAGLSRCGLPAGTQRSLPRSLPQQRCPELRDPSGCRRRVLTRRASTTSGTWGCIFLFPRVCVPGARWQLGGTSAGVTPCRRQTSPSAAVPGWAGLGAVSNRWTGFV